MGSAFFVFEVVSVPAFQRARIQHSLVARRRAALSMRYRELVHRRFQSCAGHFQAAVLLRNTSYKSFVAASSPCPQRRSQEQRTQRLLHTSPPICDRNQNVTPAACLQEANRGVETGGKLLVLGDGDRLGVAVSWICQCTRPSLARR